MAVRMQKLLVNFWKYHKYFQKTYASVILRNGAAKNLPQCRRFWLSLPANGSQRLTGPGRSPFSSLCGRRRFPFESLETKRHKKRPYQKPVGSFFVVTRMGFEPMNASVRGW